MKDQPLKGRRVLIVATDGFEQSELEVPRDTLAERGADVVVAAPERGTIRGWSKKDWGREVDVDTTLDKVVVARFDAIVLPGGQMNPDALRLEPRAIELIRAFAEAGKPVAAICHAPWLLIDAGLVEGRKLTSWPSLRADLRNAGGAVVDQEVVVDRGVITSRKPEDLPAFCDAVAQAVVSAERSPSAQAA